MTNGPYICQGIAEAEYEVKKSRFIGVVMPCQDENTALKQLQHFAKQHPQANHLAFAWRIRQTSGVITERCFDAGEPSGTAGRPILAPLEGQSIINTVVGVIRYFGGIKLGTGGLTRAYGTAAKLALDKAKLQPWVDMAEFQLTIPYAELQSLQYKLKQSEGEIIDQRFDQDVTVTVRIPAHNRSAIIQQFTKTY
jgi:uncharacterized YigZ family protein